MPTRLRLPGALLSYASYALVPCALVLAPAVARAEDPLPDAVVLRDGSAVRGRLAEIVPEEHVTIMAIASGQGERRRIAWAEIDRITANGEPQVPAASP